MTLLRDGEFTVSEGIPQLDRTVARSGNDLTVVGRERDGQDVAVVPDETAGRGARRELPEPQRLVP